METCLACGMPMMKDADHGGGDASNAWCVHCCLEDGTHKTYDEVLNGMAMFMLSDMCEQVGLEKAADMDDAIVRAKAYMQTMPAWQGA
jgi:hypothetical protein